MMKRMILAAMAAGLVTLMAAEASHAQFYGGRGRGWGVGFSSGNFGVQYGRPNYGWYDWGGPGFYGYPGNYWGPTYNTWRYPNYYYGNYSVPMYIDGGVQTASHQGQVQDYNSFYSPPRPNDRVELRIAVPDPMARVTIENQPTMQRGVERTFVSPPLEPGKDYVYHVKATWSDQGREVTREKQVEVRPGQMFTVNFRDQAGEPRDQMDNTERRDYSGDQARPAPRVDDLPGATGTDTNRVTTVNGSIVRIEGTQLVVKDAATGGERTFRIAEGATVVMDGRNVQPQQLKSDMKVRLTPDANSPNMVSRVEVTGGSAPDRD